MGTDQATDHYTVSSFIERVSLFRVALRMFEEAAEEPAFLGRGLRFLDAALRLNNCGSLGFDRR
jgi:hypothetical protein